MSGLPSEYIRDFIAYNSKKKISDSANIADKAKEIIYGDRERVYGHPGKNLELIAKFWSDYLGADIKADNVCDMMILLKLSRLKNTPDHEDSMVDLIGYTLLKKRIKE